MIYSAVLVFVVIAMIQRTSQAFRMVSSSPLYLTRLGMSSLNMNIDFKVGFMFPGQGAQTVGMAKSLTAEVPSAKKLFDDASGILGYDLLQKCINGPKEELDSTVISQPAIFVSSMAALEKLKIDDPTAIESATVAMGLSLGEYSALCFAGAFSFEDGVRLTKARGEAMQAASNAANSGMVAIVGLDVAAVQKLCDAAVAQSGKPISIANYLVDGNYAISGAKEACEAAQSLAKSFGCRMAVPLAVAGAFHTSFMQPAVPPLEKILAQVQIHRPRIPVISNVDAKPHFEQNDIRQTLAKQVTNPVQWETIMTNMLQSPSFIKSYEIGPGTVCRGIVKRFGKKYEVVNVQV
jgi:[acyl-carrier-protein] S-malonyltransferase